MARTGTVNMSSIAALEGMPLKADYLLRIKERLDVRATAETSADFREEAAAMCYEAIDRAERSRELKAAGKALLEEAEAEMQEAEALTNTRRETLASRMGF